jgi:hypothetical protein
VASTIVDVRILPPLAIARFGSSADPMDNYDLTVPHPVGAREICAADTFLIDPATGDISIKRPPFHVRFRDGDGNIRPISPFLEVWVRIDGQPDLVPLTPDVLRASGLAVDALHWSVEVASRKAFRRTGDRNDIVEARTGPFNDHVPHALSGVAPNFLASKSVPFGQVQFARPSSEIPEIRLRFTPAAGRVYSDVYDSAKGTWKGFVEPDDLTTDPNGVRRCTNPCNIFSGTTKDGNWVSAGDFDDACDGFVNVALDTAAGELTAYARVSVGPPTFAPDSLPVRTVGDELEQVLLGPDFDGPVAEADMADVKEIVRRALETVRLMNTAHLNSAAPGVDGMALSDFLTWKRALEPIVVPAVADALAIRARHERILIALESGTLAWFARILRDYSDVGLLTEEGRRKMPALMRGADGNHLALTRRQVSKVRAAAEYVRVLAGRAGHE